MVAALLMSSLVSPIRADEKAANAIVDKAIKAMGGEEKLKKAATASWKAKGIITFQGNDNELTSQTTIQGLEKSRREIEGDFGGNKFMGVVILNGSKGWRKFGDDEKEIDGDALEKEKRRQYVQLVPILLLPLKDKAFKVDTAPEEKVDDKPATVLKVTGPDGQDFKIFFDKESGLPVKHSAKVFGFGDQEEVDEDVTYSDYKDFDGVKKATKSHGKRNGEKFIENEITEFKVLDKVDPETFAVPK